MLEIDALSIILEKNQGIRFASCNHHALFVNQMIKARRSFFFSCRRQFSWPYGWSGFDSVKLVWRNEAKEETLVICCLNQKFLKNAFQSGAVHSWLDLTATYYICLFSSVIPCCLPRHRLDMVDVFYNSENKRGIIVYYCFYWDFALYSRNSRGCCYDKMKLVLRYTSASFMVNFYR